LRLADRLREALAAGHRRQPVLLPGDVLELEEPGAGTTPAAVLVPVVERPSPTVILTLRPETMRKHPGQISFPGGRIDADDDGAVAAALREAEEEIGLPPSAVEVIGLADRYRTVTGFEVTPVVGVVPPDLPIRPHPGQPPGAGGRVAGTAAHLL
jgi:8-oxo-dGTP pyrophosphatase MutT (NUDIX family)